MNYVGIDYHKKYSVATVISQGGAILKKGVILANRFDAFADFLKPFGEVTAVVEATRGWSVPVDILDQLVIKVLLAHPTKLKVIAEHAAKTDQIDSYVLALLARAGWIPEAYLRSRPNRDRQLILRVRCFHVRLRTSLKNRIHDLIDRQAEPVRINAQLYKDLFGKKGLAWLGSLQLAFPADILLKQLLAAYEVLSAQIRESDGLVKDLLKSDPNCQLIATVPGFGPFFSVLANTEIGVIQRFFNSSRLCSYAGIVPSTDSSGGKTRHGPIIKQSNHWLRWAFIEAVAPAVAADAGIRKFYESYRQTKGINVAKVVTARRLCCIVYRVLKQQSAYYQGVADR